MGWATNYIHKLKNGETIKIRPRGNSMTGKINSGQLCTICPVEKDTALSKDDIVLCNVNGNQYLHLISAIKGTQYQISNNHGFVNGTISRKNIFGKCINVE